MLFFYALAFLLGTAVLQLQVTLPSALFLWLFPLLLLAAWRFRTLRLVLFAALGFLWAAIDAHDNLNKRIPQRYYQQELNVIGRVVELPEIDGQRQRFRFLIEQVDQTRDFPTPMLVRLSWFGHDNHPDWGEYWSLRVKLKPPRGFMNPATFDYEGWLFRESIGAVGYVRPDHSNRRLARDSAYAPITALRAKIGALIDFELGKGRAAAALRALTIGDRNGFSRSDWMLFRETGTNHLIAISGLHIGIAGGVTFWLIGALWRRIPWLCLRFPACQAAAIGAIIGALLYSALAGFTVPTQRAVLMLSMVMAGLLLRTGAQPIHSLSLALIAVLLIDPAASLSAGFWLSFFAVAVILSVITHRTGGLSGGLALVRLQLFISLGLAPVLLLWQIPVPLASPLINMFAVPLFSILIIPLALAAVSVALVWIQLGAPLLEVTAWLLEKSFVAMEYAAGIAYRIEPLENSSEFLWISTFLGLLLLLLPRGLPGRWLGALLLAPLFLFSGESEPLPRGAAVFTLFDVGQGMAMVIQTRNHTLVYDSGPAYSKEFNAGSGILAPFLGRAGIERIDRLIVSNGDSDHSGGTGGLLAYFKIDSILSGEPERLQPIEAAHCNAGMSWNWDGVEFQLLHPVADKSIWRGNDASCVLRVEAQAGTVLVTGDVESRAEQRLLQCCGDLLAADIVTVPHHGSVTSSTPAFVAAVNAKHALVSSGYLNRYGFPKPSVTNRWMAAGAELYTTAESGALQYELLPNAGITGPKRHRVDGARYWSYPAP